MGQMNEWNGMDASGFGGASAARENACMYASSVYLFRCSLRMCVWNLCMGYMKEGEGIESDECMNGLDIRVVAFGRLVVMIE